MSDYGGDSPEHRSAVKQLSTARARALDSIHLIRSEQPDRANANLVRISDQRREPHPSSEATASVVDYLTHLRPHAANTEAWNTSLNLIEIPETIEGPSPGLKRGSGGQYRCTRMPYLNINDMGSAIRAANTEIVYAKSGGEATFEGTYNRDGAATYRVAGHDLTAKGFRQYQQGAELGECDHRQQRALSTPGTVQRKVNTEFEPASRSDDEVKFQFVYTLGQLMSLYEIADTIATKADLLADINTPDFESGGQGAV